MSIAAVRAVERESDAFAISAFFRNCESITFRENDRPDGDILGPFCARFDTVTSGQDAQRQLNAVLAEALGLKLVQTVLFHEDDKLVLRIKPAGNCGFCTVKIGPRKLFIEVIPKIDGADDIGLMVMAGKLPDLSLKTAYLQQRKSQSLLLFIVEAYRQALLELLLASGGLRCLHEVQETVLRGRVRGRVQVSKYLSHLTRGQPLQIPCEYPSHQLDNTPNRALRWALELLIRKCWGVDLPLVDGVDLKQELMAIRQLFKSIPLTQIGPGELERVGRLPGAFDSYFQTKALPIASWVIANLGVAKRGGSLESAGFSYDMAKVFESALAVAMARRLKTPVKDIAQKGWNFTVSGDRLGSKRGSFRPDIFVPKDGDLLPIVIDTKWKAALARAESSHSTEEHNDEYQSSAVALEIKGIKLTNSDIYQILGYAYVARLNSNGGVIHGNVPGALVYPVSSPTGLDKLPITLHRRNQTLSLFLVPWVVGDGNLGERTTELIDVLFNMRKV